MLRFSIIHGNNWIAKSTILGHCAEADHAGGGLLCAGDDSIHYVPTFRQGSGDEIGAVIHGEVRLMIERAEDVRIIRIVIFALNREGRDVVVANQRGGNIVLRAKRV